MVNAYIAFSVLTEYKLGDNTIATLLQPILLTFSLSVTADYSNQKILKSKMEYKKHVYIPWDPRARKTCYDMVQQSFPNEHL